MKHAFFIGLLFIFPLYAKEVALSFDDAPNDDSLHFKSKQRTELLIKKLSSLNIKGAMIFANPCKNPKNATAQLEKYVKAGHFIANHTCYHSKLDEVGLKKYVMDLEYAETFIASLYNGQKFFRYPYLNEGSTEKVRDDMRGWLKMHGYRNGMVSIDDDEYLFSWAINKAKEQRKKIDYKKVEKLFVEYLIGAAEFYDQAAVKYLGYSPKHVILLHEVDATVMFIDALVKEFRHRDWKIISAQEAYQDKLYFEEPKNLYENNGIIAQMILEKKHEQIAYKDPSETMAELNRILGLSE